MLIRIVKKLVCYNFMIVWSAVRKTRGRQYNASTCWVDREVWWAGVSWLNTDEDEKKLSYRLLYRASTACISFHHNATLKLCKHLPFYYHTM